MPSTSLIKLIPAPIIDRGLSCTDTGSLPVLGPEKQSRPQIYSHCRLHTV
jgi:hypothetical protein